MQLHLHRRIGTVALALTVAEPVWAAASERPAHYDVSVVIALSPTVAARLAALHETVTVSDYYFGDPAPFAVNHADEVGQIDLGRATVEIPGRGGEVEIRG